MGYDRPDHYTRRAKAAGYAARSVYKLDEIARRMTIIPRAPASVLDLGCYPGSWSKWLLERGLRVVGVDMTAPELSGGTFIVSSVYEVTPERLLDALGGPTPLVVSDMAPLTSGSRLADHCRQLELADHALSLARAVLRPGGAFVVKVFDGEDAPAFVNRVRTSFEEVRRFKPDATRDQSVEFFLAARGYRAPLSA